MDNSQVPDKSSPIEVSQQQGVSSGDDCSKNLAAESSQLTADQIRLHLEHPKPQEPKSLALYGFATTRMSPSNETHVTEALVEQVQLAAERQIEKSLAKHHEELLSKIGQLLITRSNDEPARVTMAIKEIEPTSEGKESQDLVKPAGKVTHLKTKTSMRTSRSLSAVFGRASIHDSCHDQILGLAMEDGCNSLTNLSLNPMCSFLDESEYEGQSQVGGVLRRTLYSPQFELIMGIAVCTNAIFIGLEIDYMTAHPERAFPAMEFIVIAYFYTALFLMELTLRLRVDFLNFIWYSDAKTLAWNYLDIAIVAASLVEVVLDIVSMSGSSGGHIDLSNVRIIRVVRVFRLIRLFRVARFVRFVRALRRLVYSILCTLKSVFWAMVLMVVIIYVFSILFTQATISYRSNSDLRASNPHLKDYWGTIGRSMLSLFMSISGGVSWIEVVEPLGSISVVWKCLFLIYIYFTYFAILNVVTGIFCQAAYESNSEDHDSMMQTVLRHKQIYTQRFKEIFEQIDNDSSGRVTLEEFVVRMNDNAVKNYFASLELQCEDALCLFDLFDHEETEGIQVEEFVMGCLRLKGTARSSDVIRLLHENRQVLSRLQLIFDHFHIDEPLLGRGSTSPTNSAAGYNVFMEKAAKEVFRVPRAGCMAGSPSMM